MESGRQYKVFREFFEFLKKRGIEPKSHGKSSIYLEFGGKNHARTIRFADHKGNNRAPLDYDFIVSGDSLKDSAESARLYLWINKEIEKCA